MNSLYTNGIILFVKLWLAVDWESRQICIQEPLGAPKLLWALTLGGFAVRGDAMAVTIKDNEKFSVSISVVDAKGNPAKIDGAPVWTPSDVNGLVVAPSADGLSAEVIAVGPLGVFQVKVEADADLSEGVKSLVGVLDVEVIAGEAAAISFSVSAPQPQ